MNNVVTGCMNCISSIHVKKYLLQWMRSAKIIFRRSLCLVLKEMFSKNQLKNANVHEVVISFSSHCRDEENA